MMKRFVVFLGLAVALVLVLMVGYKATSVFTIPALLSGCSRGFVRCTCSNAINSSLVVVSSQNHIYVFTGRWKFLRVLFPYLFRELRRSGGILDKVWFMMIQYDHETLTKLTRLVEVANNLLEEEVFELHFMGYKPGTLPPSDHRFETVYYEVFADLIDNPYNRYFKLDDDIVYIHPNTFRTILENKDSSRCFMHFGNIISNWRCNIKHQQLGLFDSKDLNPNALKFDDDPYAKCGVKSPQCAELATRTFLHYYHKGELDKYLFPGLELLHDRKQFSIQLHLLDKDLIVVKSMLESGKIGVNDEKWWTVVYSKKPDIMVPNCIVGEALVVHFSYRLTSKELLDLGLLQEFEIIAHKEVGNKMDPALWKALEY